MSAAVLREAAALMRERAEAATYTPVPWGVDEIGAVWAQEADGQPVSIASHATDEDARHIASWHPTVALAVADWLDGVALFLEARADEEEWLDLDGDPIAPEDTHAIGSALTVATAYLRRQS